MKPYIIISLAIAVYTSCFSSKVNCQVLLGDDTLQEERVKFRCFNYADEIDNPFSELKQWNDGVRSVNDGEIVLIGEIQLPDYELIYSQRGFTFLVPKDMGDVLQNDSIALCHHSCYLFQIASPLSDSYKGIEKQWFPSKYKSLTEEQYMSETVADKSKESFIKSKLRYQNVPRAYFLYVIRKRSYNWNSNFVHDSLQRRWESYPIGNGSDYDFLRIACPIW